MTDKKSGEATTANVESAERSWNDAILRRDVDSAAKYLAVSTLAITPVAEPLNDRDISGNFLITDVWVLRNGEWLIAERHSSRQEKASVPVREAFQAFEANEIQ